MKKNTITLALGAVVIILALGGCSLVNQVPRVNLTATPADPYWFETVTLAANASDPDGDRLSYQWFLDGILQTTASQDTVVWTPLDAGTYVVQVVVSDGVSSTSRSANVLVTENGSATLTFRNSVALRSIVSIQISPITESVYGSNLLSVALASGATVTIPVPPNTYDYIAMTGVDKSSAYWESQAVATAGFDTLIDLQYPSRTGGLSVAPAAPRTAKGLQSKGDAIRNAR